MLYLLLLLVLMDVLSGEYIKKQSFVVIILLFRTINSIT